MSNTVYVGQGELCGAIKDFENARLIDPRDPHSASRLLYCPHCSDAKVWKVKHWDSSVAMVADIQCPDCGHIFERFVERRNGNNRDKKVDE